MKAFKGRRGGSCARSVSAMPTGWAGTRLAPTSWASTRVASTSSGYVLWHGGQARSGFLGKSK